MNVFRDLREKKDITQESLADKLGVERSTVAKWESGVSKPRADTLVQLAKVLDCTVDDLLK